MVEPSGSVCQTAFAHHRCNIYSLYNWPDQTAWPGEKIGNKRQSVKKRHNLPLILAIDTSCDETSVAVVSGVEYWSNVVASQTELHRPYGGVFPTVAKLAHQQNIGPAIALALKQAGVSANELSAVAVTVGPGLAPALEVGIAAARSFAQTHHLPLIPANHLEGHVLSVFARPRPRVQSQQIRVPQFDISQHLPALALIISGGNSLFVKVELLSSTSTSAIPQPNRFDRVPNLKLDQPFDSDSQSWQPQLHYTILGRTLDDAAGECLDKVGRMLNLGYPAGPVIEEFAKLGNPHAFDFPLPLTQTKSYDVSFSGMKTHARNLVEKLGGADSLSRQQIYDFCACLQTAVFRHLMYKFEKILSDHPGEFKEIWLGGGVAANMALRKTLRTTIKKHSSLPLRTPHSKRLCGDNAAMIGIQLSASNYALKNLSISS